MLNEATKKAIVTEMAPPELATQLKLNADRYDTHAQMTWQVLSYVNLKLPSQPTTMWIDHVEHGEDGSTQSMNGRIADSCLTRKEATSRTKRRGGRCPCTWRTESA